MHPLQEYVLISSAALLASLLTFFSGFGLGTLLMPVFMIFFEIKTAIALTAVVHLLNNFFKISLTYKNIDKKTILYFGITSLLGSIIGAELLHRINDYVLLEYNFMNQVFYISLFKLVIAILLMFFAAAEMFSFLQFKVSKNILPLGGIISGFFGGLSGHQGALRSAFLLKSGLAKEQFIATGIIIACMIDVGRISVYSNHFNQEILQENLFILLCAVVSAFAGAYLGSKLLKKITYSLLQYFVSTLIFLFAIALALGLI